MKSDSAHPPASSDPRCRLTPVYTLLEDARIIELIARCSRPLVLEAINTTLADCRERLSPGDELPTVEELVERVRAAVDASESERLRPVVNASGVVLHTGLGRAVLSRRAVDALAGLDRCCNMQVDLRSGERGRRNFMSESLLTRITGAEAAMVVNNNAAATYLLLAALCAGQEVIVSHGQLIEIGGSFRLPDCIRQSGAQIVTVGTTNRTHLRDYEQALGERTGAIFRANPSNFRVVGFRKEVSIAELVTLKEKRDVIVIDDLGCGALVDTTKLGLPEEPTVQASIAAGADLACFSGDKLIGGAQAGIIVGRKDLIARIKKHPLTRMMRVCKLTDLVLEQTLRLFLEPQTLLENHPTLRMLTTPLAALEQRARALKARCDAAKLRLDVQVKQDESAVGGGSMPATPLETWALALRSPVLGLERLGYHLRQNEPPIIARIGAGAVLLDMRTLLEGDDEHIFAALQRIDELDS